MSRFSFGLLVVLLSATPATAVIDYGGGFRNRQVATITGFEGGGASTSDLKDTAATGFWSETASSSYSNPCPCPPFGSGGTATASASQISDLGDFVISMSGTVSAADTLGYEGNAQSLLSVSFSLASDSPYISSMSSSGPDVNFSFANSGSQQYGANSSGTLAAGTYSLSINFQASSSAGTGGPYLYSLLIVPEPSSAVLLLIGGLLVTSRRTSHG